jgi:hypothetical protein
VGRPLLVSSVFSTIFTGIRCGADGIEERTVAGVAPAGDGVY